MEWFILSQIKEQLRFKRGCYGFRKISDQDLHLNFYVSIFNHILKIG